MCEDTLTPRSETIPGLVELVTLNVGDEFQAGDTGGTVVWKVNKGSAKAVDVLYDGHSKPISIAPSLKVMVRKLKEDRTVDTFEEANRACDELQAMVVCSYGEAEPLDLPEETCSCCKGDTRLSDFVLCEDCGEQYCIDCVSTVIRCGDKTHLCRDCHDPDPLGLTVEPPAPEDLPPAPIPSQTIRVIRLTADGPKTMPVTVQPPLPTCKFDLTLNAEQIRLLVFDTVKQMFYSGLYHGWTRETFFEVAKAKFPHLKAGQNYESCLAQIRLYHCALKNAGRMQ